MKGKARELLFIENYNLINFLFSFIYIIYLLIINKNMFL